MYINRSNSSWGEAQTWGMPEVWATRERAAWAQGEHFKPYHAKALKALVDGKVSVDLTPFLKINFKSISFVCVCALTHARKQLHSLMTFFLLFYG